MTPTPVCAETQGLIVQETLESALANTLLHYRVYLPPCYALTGKRYPTLIMLHGWVQNSTAMNDDQWVRLGLTAAADQGIGQHKLAPMIIVMPNSNDLDQGNDGSPYGKVIATELLPDVAAKFCASNDPALRAIGGLSRGGFWAFSTAFQYPNLFGKVGGHSPYVYPGDFKDYNPYDMLDHPIPIGGLKVYVDHGAQDFVADNVREFVRKLKLRGATLQYVVNPTGTHVESYWAAHVAEYLDFYAAGWPLDANTFPNCTK